jgi:hypothetical protein
MLAQNGGQCPEKANSSADAVAIVIPVLNEAAVMPRLLRLLAILDPAPAELAAVRTTRLRLCAKVGSCA